MGGEEQDQEGRHLRRRLRPGLDAEKFFKSQFKLNGGEITGEIRSPLRSPDFAPFLQKVADLKPDAVFVFLPSGQGAAFMKQFGERGLDKSGIRLIATGDVTDDDQLNDMGDVALGVVNSHHYSAAHPVADQQEVRAGVRGGQQVPAQLHGGRRLRRHARDLQGARGDQGQGGGDALLAAMKGQVFESPRGRC
jgi:branched-chain amino acid transport system substrate-binding protein